LNDAALVLFVGEFIGCVVFCVLFGRKWRRWLHTRMGPNLFFFMFALAVLQGIAVLRLIFPLEWIDAHAVTVRFWSFLVLNVVVWWRVVILIRVQHEDAVEERAVAHEDALTAHEDAGGAHGDAVQAHENATKAHEDAERAHRFAQEAQRAQDDTDPDLKKVGS
jgi:phosphoglycerol transferase MdoB-like AlkP superfamily enzyme